MKTESLNYPIIESIKATGSSIKKRKPIFGIFVNDAFFNVSITSNGNRINHEGYQAWVHMIHRCYGKSVEKYPTYENSSVCSEWRSFSKFLEWWRPNYVSGWCLDKDILGCEGIYSPETCIYIPQWLNKIMNTCDAKRGDLSLGVTMYRGMYRSYVKNSLTGKHEFVGDFAMEREAHEAYKKRKIEIIESMKQLMDDIDVRIYPIIVSNIYKKFTITPRGSMGIS